MKSKIAILITSLGLLLCSGCDFMEQMLSDIDGWDLSVCANYPGACWECYWDNIDKVLETQ